MRSTFYVTTPIYYVNDVPHIGHAYTTVAADILSRYNRLRGRDVFFLTGTDEHGQKVDEAARARGISPKEHSDEMVLNFEKLWKALEISNDSFIRTTDEEHKKIVQEMLQRLYDKGEIVKRSYEGWYCTPDERFWTEKELDEGNCPDCGRPVEKIQEENYFFLMSKYGNWLADHIQKNGTFILPETRRNEVLGFLRANPLNDHNIGFFFVPSGPYRMLNFAGNKIVHQRVHNNPVFGPLHPGCLTSADHLGAQPRILETVDEQPGRRAFTNCRVGSQHYNFQGLDCFNFTTEKMKVMDLRWFANISDFNTILRRQFDHFRIF
ncbi:MAG: class I tRNA ligase family protein [Nitrospirota bacterium]|nr:MAG: class I tRNA ligase family protein [Nitrospirota bacterium]